MSYLYPYGDTQQLNLAWFLAKFKELYEYVMQLDPSGETAMDAILSRFTEQYDSTKTYIPGDYCIQEGYIYKANTTTGGTFNPNAWDAALPVNDVQGLRILLGGLSTDLTELEQNAVTNTQYTPGAADADGLLRQTKNGTAETVMTVDAQPTANSQNPVKSGAVYSELTNEANIRSKLNTANLLNNVATSGTVQSINFTVNRDKTVTLNGTSGGWNGFLLNTFKLKAGNYTLKSGIIDSTLNHNCYVEIKNGNQTIINTESAAQRNFTLDEETEITVKIHARPGIALNNVIVYPEIKYLGDLSDYTQYAPTNTELLGSLNSILPLDTVPTSGNTKGITSGAVYNELPIYVNNKINTDVACSGNTFNQLGTITISKGLWLIIAYHEWRTSSTQEYSESLADITHSAEITGIRNLSMVSGGGMPCCAFYNVSENTTIRYGSYIYGATANNAKNVEISAVRIKT